MRNEIVVGLDDSPSGEAASAWAAQHAGSTGSAVSADHRGINRLKQRVNSCHPGVEQPSDLCHFRNSRTNG